MSTPTKRETLREIAKRLSEHEASTSPSVLADRLFAAIPPNLYGHYLREALGTLAITFVTDARRYAFKSVVKTAQGGGRASRVKVPQERTQIMVDTNGNESRVPNPEYRMALSHKRQLIKSEWDTFLEKNLPTGNPTKPYIPLATATVRDLQRAAEVRRSMSKALDVEATKYDRLAAVMVAKGAKTLGLLNAEDVKGLL